MLRTATPPDPQWRHPSAAETEELGVLMWAAYAGTPDQEEGDDEPCAIQELDSRLECSTGGSDSARSPALREFWRPFPGLAGPAVRLDGPAGAQTHGSALEAMAAYLRTSNADLGGVHEASLATEQLVTGARQATAAFLGADADEVGFGLNATSLNLQLSRSAAPGS